MKTIWIIVLSTLIVTAVTFVVTLVWWLFAPMYTAIALLQVTPPEPSPICPGYTLYAKDTMDGMLMSQAKLVKSELVLTEAARTREIRATKWFSIDPEDVVSRLDEEIRVRPISFGFIEVSITGTAANAAEKADLAQIVNAVARTFEKASRASLSKDRRREISHLLEERNSMEAELNRVRGVADKAMKEMQVGTTRQGMSVFEMQLAQLVKQKLELKLRQAKARSAVEAIEQRRQNGTITSAPEVRKALEADRTLRILQDRALDAEIDKDLLILEYGLKHGSVKAVENRLSTIQKIIAERKELVTQQAVTVLLNECQAELEALTSQLLDFQEELDRLEHPFRDRQLNIARLKDLAKDENRLETRISTIDDALIRYRLLERGEQRVRLRQIATLPRKPSMPKWNRMIPLGAIGGLAVGLILALLRMACIREAHESEAAAIP